MHSIRIRQYYYHHHKNLFFFSNRTTRVSVYAGRTGSMWEYEIFFPGNTKSVVVEIFAKNTADARYFLHVFLLP